ncbi:MAG TPA: hypothetical protein VJQ56_03640 [Blastocatellia bacterium]|nr:hypothetical protein [Blastocatellia bacterium]
MTKESPAKNVLILVLASLAILGAGGTGMLAFHPHSGQLAEEKVTQKNAAELMAILRDEQLRMNDPDQVLKAIESLGQMKEKDAIDDLVRLITFARADTSVKGDYIDEIRLLTPGDRYPALIALMEIGKPAMPALINTIQANDPASGPYENAIYAVMGIYREAPQKAVRTLKKASQLADTAVGKTRLLGAVDKIGSIVKTIER